MSYQLFPDLSKSEYIALKDDIKENGVLVPIEYDDDGNVLDGFHRLQACAELGIKTWPSVTRFNLSEMEKRTHARRMNMNRRHLTRKQKREQIKGQLIDTPEWSNNRIALLLGVSHNTVIDVRDELESACQIDKLEKLEGADGKEYPAEMPETPTEPEPQPELGGLFVQSEKKREKEVEKVKSLPSDLQDRVVTGKLALKTATKKSKKRKKEAEWEVAQESVSETDQVGWPESIQLIAGDFADVAQEIEDGSIATIITDPPYPREYLHLYKLLAEQAARLLESGGCLLVMAGQSYLPDVISLMTPHLNYRWMISYDTPGGQSAQIWDRKINTFWKPVLCFVKDEYNGDWNGDKIRSDVNDNDKRFHEWGQSESGIGKLVYQFSGDGVVLDPFVGGGTTALVCYRLRKDFIGIDKDLQAIEITKYRIMQEIGNDK